MTEKGNMVKFLEHLDGDGCAELLVVIQEQLCAQIDRWFAKYEAGDEHADGSSNVLAVEMAGTPEDPYIFVGQGLYVTELTRQGPYQAVRWSGKSGQNRVLPFARHERQSPTYQTSALGCRLPGRGFTPGQREPLDPGRGARLE